MGQNGWRDEGLTLDLRPGVNRISVSDLRDERNRSKAYKQWRDIFYRRLPGSFPVTAVPCLLHELTKCCFPD